MTKAVEKEHINIIQCMKWLGYQRVISLETQVKITSHRNKWANRDPQTYRWWDQVVRRSKHPLSTLKLCNSISYKVFKCATIWKLCLLSMVYKNILWKFYADIYKIYLLFGIDFSVSSYAMVSNLFLNLYLYRYVAVSCTDFDATEAGD
jgi:hypothetical protein